MSRDNPTRAQAVREALAEAAREGHQVAPAVVEIMGRYVREELTAERMVAEVLSLDPALAAAKEASCLRSTSRSAL